ncbi:MAG: hypothetical protein KGZ90_03680 [Algoriphagus sp.]|nr:hypothetical protein [Algoriphagus sp.]
MENELKLELIEKLLQVSEEQILLEIKSVLDQRPSASSISDELYSELMKRRENALTNKTKLFSWEEVKNELLKK